jgi:Protein of unknown function (DUF2852)
MTAVFKLNEWQRPKPIWIVVLLLGLWISWPVGLVVLAVLFWTGRLEGWKRAGLDLWQEGIGSMRQPGNWWSPRASGNNAFDQYRSDTLQRLEEEQKEFREFLSRLRAAKDKAEFDQFMKDRRNQAGSALLPTQS